MISFSFPFLKRSWQFSQEATFSFKNIPSLFIIMPALVQPSPAIPPSSEIFTPFFSFVNQ